MLSDCREVEEEEEQDDVEQGKVEQHLGQEDEEEIIKEESRKRKQAILEKYRQKQMQNQQLESICDNSSQGTVPFYLFYCCT
jgi:serine/threonine-protein kinase PRP4